MPYKISGTKSETSRVIIIKESDWSIESSTVVSGSGGYSVEELESGSKLAFSRAEDGEIVGFGSVVAEEMPGPPVGNAGIFGGGYAPTIVSTNTIDYINISTPGNATNFGDTTVARWALIGLSNGANDRGVFGGGYTTDPNAVTDIIEYITITTTADATDFGDLTVARRQLAGTSNGTNNRGVFPGGRPGGNTNVIDYITISTPGNAIDFGDLNAGRRDPTATSNGTSDRGVIGGGYGPDATNVIDYITISSTGNAIDFGDLTVGRQGAGGTSNGTNDRGVFGSGHDGSNYTNIIDYITISSTGNAIDFGDLTSPELGATAATSNATNERGIFGGGYTGSIANVIDYITISTPGNAIDFGDLTEARYSLGVASNA